MRLAHLADPHLGFRQYHRLDARGRNQREVDVATAFSRAIDGVIAEQPDAVVVAGDLFHAVRPTNFAILHAVREFARLRRDLPRAPVIVIAGNHDTPRSSDTTSIFGLLEQLGVEIADDGARHLNYPELDLAVLAVPHQALFEPPRRFAPEGRARHQVLVIHGQTPGLIAPDRGVEEPGGADLSEQDLGADWGYVALGHYHVQCQVGPHHWYAGSLDYVSSNPWGELREERRRGLDGKGWLLADLGAGTVQRRAVEAPRRFLDLRWLDGRDLAAPELDRLVADAVNRIPGGIGGSVVRQVVLNTPRAVARELDHARIRGWKAEALHFQLDLRRPEPVARTVGMGAPGRRETLGEILENFLADRDLPAGVDRDAFVARGMEFLAAVDTPVEES